MRAPSNDKYAVIKKHFQQGGGIPKEGVARKLPALVHGAHLLSTMDKIMNKGLGLT